MVSRSVGTGGRVAAAVVTATVLASGALAAQSGSSRATVERERADYVAWLRTAGVSPLRALALRPFDEAFTLGPRGSDVPLAGVEPHRLVPQGEIAALEQPEGRRLVPRHRPVSLGAHTILLGGPRERPVVTVFGPARREVDPTFYPYEASLAFTGPLTPADRPATVRILAADGVEVDATEAGTVAVPIGGATHRLRVLRVPVPGTEESELEIYFRDATNAHGTYPAGRFVALVPLGDGRYRLDFNRARNPFCAYSTVYPCPVPWPGNALPVAVAAGERYAGTAPGPEEAPR
jgi:hypothetical protein